MNGDDPARERWRFYHGRGPMLLIDEVATIYRVSVATITRALADGTFNPWPIYTQPWRWLTADIESDLGLITGRLCPPPVVPPRQRVTPPRPRPYRHHEPRAAEIITFDPPDCGSALAHGAAPPWCESWCPWRELIADLDEEQIAPGYADVKWNTRMRRFERWRDREDRRTYTPDWEYCQ